MANYCWNTVAIRGDKETLDTIQSRFEDYGKQNSFYDFGNMVLGIKNPEPAEGFGRLYYWDTKWWDMTIERECDEWLQIDGSSAWCPPTRLLREMSEVFNVEITADYFEAGEGFAGCTIYKDGVADDDCRDYDEWMYLYDRYNFFEDVRVSAENGHDLEWWMEHILPKMPKEFSESDMESVKQIFNDVEAENPLK